MTKKVPNWILKTEPETFGWSHQIAEKVAVWDGVRNHQAKANLARLKCGELAYFYHSGKARELVGVVEVVRKKPIRTRPMRVGNGLPSTCETFAKLQVPVALKA